MHMELNEGYKEGKNNHFNSCNLNLKTKTVCVQGNPRFFTLLIAPSEYSKKQ